MYAINTCFRKKYIKYCYLSHNGKKELIIIFLLLKVTYIMMKTSFLVTTFSKFSSLANLKSDLIYKNPYNRLKQYLEIPLLDEDSVFSPDVETISAAQALFIPRRFHSINFLTSGIGPEKFPNHDLPEVILMGRSNAGKSSLLKAIFRNVPDLLIKTSKRPGHTKTAQFFQIGSKLCIVDMPGYGYHQPEWIEDVLESCIKRKNCVRTFLLIDGKVGVLESDVVALDMLESFRVPYAIVMTKIDKATDSRLLRNILHLKNVKKSSVYYYAQPFMVSSHTYEGLGNLLAFIGHITGNLELKNIKRISS